MKRLLYCAAALATLLFASCQQENLEPVAGGTTVTYTVEAPGALQTKAVADGTNVDELIYEVWYGDQKLYQNSTTMAVDPADGKNKAKVTLDLVNDQTYTILFWAQVAEADAYVTDELTAVTYAKGADEYLANDESLAAFYAVDTVVDGVAAHPTVLLKRPFAQVNLCTLNSKAAAQVAGDYNITMVNSKMTLESVPTTFNVLDGSVDGEVKMEFAYNAVPGGEDKTIKVNGKEYYYAGMNYVFAGANLTLTYDIQTSLNGSTSYAVVNNVISDVPVRENFRTNIVGNLLTSKTDYEIIVDAEFNENDLIVEDGKNYVSISSAEELANVAEEIANGSTDYKNIMLGGDIDLAELSVATRSTVVSNWTPIGTSEKPFDGIFDGNGYTIKNLALVETEAKEGKAYIGFFGYAKNATIKNVTFENVYINIPCLDIDHSQGHIGAVAGSLEGTSTIENVTVKGDITVYATQTANGASRVAVVAGGNTSGNVTMKNVHVIANEGSSLIANNNTGALAGQLQGKMYFENCSSNIDVTVNKFFAGGLIGIAAGDSKFVNCHTTGNVAVVAGREGRHNDEYRVGGIAGGWADGKTKVCTLENCSYTGNVSGKNADGAVAEPLDYMGYVGRGYTLSNCAGSMVRIDNTGFVQKYDNQYGIYTVINYVQNAEELQAALDSGYDVVFLNDIEGDVTATQAADVKLTVDGNGHEFAGVITVDGKSATYTTAGLTVKNVNFVAESISADACVRLGDGNNATRYTCNVTLENCTFDVPGAVGVKSYTGGDKNLTIKGCTATDRAHSLVQAKGVDGVLIENCTVNSKNGMNFNNSDNVTVNQCTTDVKGYAVRFGESSGGSGAAEKYAINNSTLKSACEDGDAVIILRGTADNSTLTITNTTLEGTKKITNNAAGATVVIDGVTAVSTADALVAALEAKQDVIFLNDITVAATKGGYNKAGILQNNAQTIDGDGYTLTVTGAGATWDCAIYTNGGTIKNLTVAGAMRGIFTAGQSSDLHIDNVVFKNVIYTFNSDGKMPANPFGVYVSNSVVNGWTSHSNMHTEVVYTNCSFGEGSGYKYCRPYGTTSFVNCTFCAGYTLDKSQTTDITFTDCIWE